MKFSTKYRWLMPMGIFLGMLLAGRVLRTAHFTFMFIPWNLFLAAIPLYFSYRLDNAENKKAAWLWFPAWLLFFPNSMYIITDLFHLSERPRVPLWYDLIILFSAAVLGAVMGFLSVINVERFLTRHVKPRNIPLIILSFFLLCGYGIYLGRYLRWNSWDVVAQPVSLLEDMLDGFVHPFGNKECWLLTVFFGVWLYIMYKYFKKLPVTESRGSAAIAKF